MRYFTVLLIYLVVFSSPSHAAEPVPGNACAAAGATISSAEGGSGHFMICETGTWKSVYSYNASGKFTKLGNQACSSGQVLKFNGTIWACAADNAGIPQVQYIDDGFTVSGSTQNGSGEASCPAGYKIIGGGCDAVMWGSEIVYSHPSTSTNSWRCAVKHSYTVNKGATVHAICLAQ
jgi:hypothetical protein